jgi:hypothetical protein
MIGQKIPVIEQVEICLVLLPGSLNECKQPMARTYGLEHADSIEHHARQAITNRYLMIGEGIDRGCRRLSAG